MYFDVMSPSTDLSTRGPFDGRHSSQAISSPSSNIATPNNEYLSSTSSDTGSLEPSPREVSDKLIEFVSNHSDISEPPRKRQKVGPTSFLGKDPELEHIIVHQCSWEIQCVSSKLSDTPAERNDIGPYVSWTLSWGSVGYITITDDTRQHILQAAIPLNATNEDVRVALLVYQESKRWARLQGRLWTEFGISLYQKNGFDCIELIFEIKWNTTTSPYNVLQASSKTSALMKVM
jgi:E3 ubiquitin-protein ligase SHPRH